MTKSHKKRRYVFMVCLIIGLLYTTTYIPQRVITTAPSSVSRIHVFDGQSGHELSLSDRRDIYTVMNNLNDTTF